jgi:FkbM family methyltransferase
LTSIPVARALPGVRCFAFEPDCDNYRLLLRNITLNGVDGAVTPFNVALMPEDGQFELELSPENLGDHRIRASAGQSAVPELEGEGRRKTVSIRARRLDAMGAELELRSPVVLKTDTQGAEVRVLESAAGILGRVDHVVAEYSPYLLRRMGDTPDSFFEELRTFPHAALLDDATAEPPRLVAASVIIDQMRSRVPLDGSTTTHLDVLFSRSADA